MDRPPKSQNMKPDISRTAAGSRMTLYLPAGISRGRADSIALRAEISARVAGSSWLASGEFAFCHPEESDASMVMEISDEVWACQSFSPRELKIPSTDSDEEKMPAVVSLYRFATWTIFSTASARSSGVSPAV